MRECANAVRKRADGIAADGFEADLEVEAVVATLDFLGKVWHLVEIVHIDAGPLVALAIAHWLREHFGGRALSLRLSGMLCQLIFDVLVQVSFKLAQWTFFSIACVTPSSIRSIVVG